MKRTVYHCLIALAALFVASRSDAAEIDYPLAIAVADNGAVYLADRNLPGIWKIEGEKQSLFFEGSKKFRTPLNAPRCVMVDAKGRVLAGDSSTRNVYRLDGEGKPQPLTGGAIGIPMSLAVASSGEIFVADLETAIVWKVPDAGGKPVKFVDVPAPRGLAFDDEGRLWVVSHGPNQLLRVSSDGKVEAVVKGRPFQFPHTVVLDKEGTAYVCDGYAKAVWKVNADGKVTKWVKGPPFINPVGLAWQGGNLLVVDPHARNVFRVNPQGEVQSMLNADK